MKLISKFKQQIIFIESKEKILLHKKHSNFHLFHENEIQQLQELLKQKNITLSLLEDFPFPQKTIMDLDTYQQQYEQNKFLENIKTSNNYKHLNSFFQKIDILS